MSQTPLELLCEICDRDDYQLWITHGQQYGKLILEIEVCDSRYDNGVVLRRRGTFQELIPSTIADLLAIQHKR